MMPNSEVNRLKKKISIIMGIILSVLCLSGCASNKNAANTTMDYDEDYLTQVCDVMIEQILPSSSKEQVEQLEQLDEFAFQSQLYQMQLPITPMGYIEASNAWIAAKDECGEYESHGDYKIEAHTDKIVVSTRAKFTEREANISFNFDSKKYLDSITIGADYTTGEILEKAGLNTILGMGTVFIVLIFISIIISLMKYIPALQEKFSKKNKGSNNKEEAFVAETPVKEEAQQGINDTELVAVITAAIAASEGKNQSDFIVRSIKRRPGNRW